MRYEPQECFRDKVDVGCSTAAGGRVPDCQNAPGGSACSWALTPQDEILIYQAVIQSISPPDSSGPRYILRSTDDRAALSPSQTGAANAAVLSTETQAGISAILGNIIWVDSRDNVRLDPTTLRVVQGGVMITLGNISVQQEHQAKTSAAYFAGPTWGGGYLYTLNWANGVWSISSALTNWIS